MRTKLVCIAVSISTGVVATIAAPLSYAQVSGTKATDTAPSEASTKAERKAARKQARAKKNAELKKLEDAGYNPGRANETNYPQDFQDAQKKAKIGTGASQ